MVSSVLKSQNLSLCLSLLSLILPSSYQVSFRKTRFNPGDNAIIYEGGATNYVGAIEFNSLTYDCQVGRATYAEKVPIWDSQTTTLTDFSTHFSFFVDVQSQKFYAAGFAFFLAPVDFEIPPNSSGGFLGLYNATTAKNTSQSQIVHVEFDTFWDSNWDPQVQHIGINVNSLSSATYTSWNASLHSGDNVDVWINYNASTKNLSVFWTYETTSTSQENNSLSYVIDLKEALPEWAKIGFTAATRNVQERHSLLLWEFSSSLEKVESRNKDSDSKRLVVIIPISATVLVAVFVAIFAIVYRTKRRKSTERTNLTSIDGDLQEGTGPRRFSYQDIVSATHNFSSNRKLGEGGFGTVYRGYLSDIDVIIAVKKISKGSKQGKKQLITEAKIISQLRHRNLVQLIGWSHDRGDFLLVYEFMPNGSLDTHLFGKKAPLAWPLRYKTVLGLASALLYLHEEWEQCVVHRDIKPSNIMLDSSFNVKLGDFGLARLIHHELGQKTTVLAGTLGYLAPEYVITGRTSKDSDVYSFGMVVLEIATGRRAVDPIEQEPEMSLVEWIWSLYGAGNLSLASDKRLEMNFDEKQVECLMVVGLWCSHPDCSLRPSIRQAFQVLNFEAALPNLPRNMPAPFYNVPTPSFGSGEPVMSVSSVDAGR